MNNEACYRGGLTPLTIGVQTIYFLGETGHTTQIFNPKIANFYANHRQNLKNALKRQKFLNLQALICLFRERWSPRPVACTGGASVASPPWGSQGGAPAPPWSFAPSWASQGGRHPPLNLLRGRGRSPC